MALWEVRARSAELLSGPFSEYDRLIQECFEVIAECIDLCSHRRDQAYFLATGLALTKARRFALGSYSLMLDGLGQEGGALLRPLIEYYELLTFVRMFPHRAQEVIDNRQPSAGKVAQEIEGRWKGLREYLNDHASHGSFSDHSTGHLYRADGSLASGENVGEETLGTNMSVFYAVSWLVAAEGVHNLSEGEAGLVNDQAWKLESLKAESYQVFDFEKGRT
ncbi:hypothetical protein AN478_02445 [Thiohalorhabdus denitrificans]|uniref:Uncharacterized protein n=1 Tax=Thiohalorhabdus denitrificans TaxID=381306 RepID=A0A0P9EG35_9GAMM|nr:hypothetical protein [Thiohalorhabdus denitrificans]KPV41449.1 hypothetical protein AN478_02445 [Thiohalorhabdus denitrificans]SCY27779.1 hypothetical protein SAMN05661077_1682 [Thiohalorhabdus denitrificans]